MKRTTLMLPHELKRRAEACAYKRGISMGELIRSSLEETLRTTPRAAADPLFVDDAVYHGKAPHDLAEGHDLYLYGEPGG